ncbi:shikimate dehydrogenase family protein [Spongiactinospora sp. 9N601]|uniref:shikimate dehydrogenase family protein n=1 Tax=Spongiactinospora sp. 9N601 TaxID=3375149 RepID=UPI00378B0752
MSPNTARMGFVGVDTANSSIRRVFPLWARELALPTDELVGHDLPLDAPDSAYRELAAGMRADPGYRGALITTHKIRMWEAAGDMFAELDEFARLCGEISSVSKRGDLLIGHAKDPLTAGLAMVEFLPRGHFARTGAEVVCLGAGGAGSAITWWLAHHDDPPRRIVCVDTDPARIERLRGVHARGGLPAGMFGYEVADAAALVRQAPPGSLVINATGMGKDRPGSPLPAGTPFPEHALVWELNYRGSLEFLAQARAQREERGLTVEDGWSYFIHGWSQAIAAIFDLTLTPDLVHELAEIAEVVR